MTLAEQWREEAREQGREAGYAAEAQRSVIEVLDTRFSPVPEGFAEKIRHEPNRT